MTEYEKLRRWRERLGLSHEELAAKLGYSRECIYWHERGITPPRNFKNANRTDRSIDPVVWQRFKRTCGDLDAETYGRKPGGKFKW